MVTEEEKKAAYFELSFNPWKALWLFSFCFASFCVGFCALYWMLDYRYEQRLNMVRGKLLDDMEQLQTHIKQHSVSDLCEGVVSFDGHVDFDDINIISRKPFHYQRKLELIRVKGERRALSPGLYQVRFVPVEDQSVESRTEEVAAQAEARTDKE